MIKLFVMDVDGTLTDGKIYIGPNGECFKAFDVKDGFGIHEILPEYGITPMIITGRTSPIVEVRAMEIGIDGFYQGVRDKAQCLRDIAQSHNILLSQIACIGDDLNDLPMMKLCGLKGCPTDAVEEVQAICDYVCNASGGHGAVREFIEWIVRRQK